MSYLQEKSSLSIADLEIFALNKQNSSLLIGGGDWWRDFIPSGVHVTNPFNKRQYYFGDYNDRPSEWQGSTWGVRMNGKTVAKGYYRTLLGW